MEGDSNQEISSIDRELQTELLVHHPHHHHKGGMITMPFILVNEAFEKVASYGLMPNMIFYLTEVYHMELATGSSILSIWFALSNGLAIFGAFISDSYLGRFGVIAVGSLFTLLGMTFLWLTSWVPQLTPSSCSEPETTCNPPTPTQMAFLISCFILMSVGSGCIRPCSIAFGADQLKYHPTLNNQRFMDRYFNWYYASATSSTVVAFTVIVYIQEQLGWQIGFAVVAMIMLCSTFMFLVGSSLYVKVKASESLFSGLIQVLVVAFKNRRIRLLPDDCYNHSKQMDQVELTEKLRFLNKACVVKDMNHEFLNKACVVKDMNHESSEPDPWSLSTVEKVESLKSVIRVLPLWSTGIIIFTTITQGFPTIQAKTMNRYVTPWFEIPAASFSTFLVLTLIIWVALYDYILVPFLAKYTNKPCGFHPKTRMGIGLVSSTVGMIISAIVETKRRDLAGPNATVDMSAMWLVPQYALLGLAEAFNAIGQMEFYYSELPESMSSIAIAMFMVSNAISGLVGSLLINVVDAVTTKGDNISWLADDINDGHLDYYYWLLCFLNLLNFLYYLACCRIYRSSSSSGKHVLEAEESNFRH